MFVMTFCCLQQVSVKTGVGSVDTLYMQCRSCPNQMCKCLKCLLNNIQVPQSTAPAYSPCNSDQYPTDEQPHRVWVEYFKQYAISFLSCCGKLIKSCY